MKAYSILTPSASTVRSTRGNEKLAYPAGYRTPSLVRASMTGSSVRSPLWFRSNSSRPKSGAAGTAFASPAAGAGSLAFAFRRRLLGGLAAVEHEPELLRAQLGDPAEAETSSCRPAVPS